MAETPQAPHGVFSLEFMADALPAPETIATPWDASGRWTQTFMVATTTSKRAHPTGELRLSRQLTGAGPELHIRYDKSLLGSGLHRTEGSITCLPDALSTPRAWRWRSTVQGAGGGGLADLATEGEGEWRDGAVILRTNGRNRRRVPIDGPPAANWALFDAVQRLSPDGPAHAFTLIDHFDQPKAGHRLVYRGSQTLRLGSRTEVRETRIDLDRGTLFRPMRRRTGGAAVPCHCFQQTGQGVVPLLFWVSDGGLLLCVSAGLEAYVLRRMEQLT